MRYVSNHVSQAFSQRVSIYDVSVAEWVVLRELLSGAAISSDLAARLGMTRGGISKVINRLEARSLLLRRVQRSDSRYQTLRLTTKGRVLVPKLAALADENDDEFFGQLTRKERDQLIAALKEIAHRHHFRKTPLE